ncbi:MAG TPA: hypothetical protein VH589_02555 [Trebonia sp.]
MLRARSSRAAMLVQVALRVFPARIRLLNPARTAERPPQTARALRLPVRGRLVVAVIRGWPGSARAVPGTAARPALSWRRWWRSCPGRSGG